MADFIGLAADFLPGSARVAGFVGREALSELYRFRVGVLTAGDEIDLNAARGAAATIRIHRGESTPHLLHGMVAEAGLLHAWAGQALYEIVLVPKIWAMTLGHMSRVFVDMSVTDIIEQLLTESDIGADDFEIKAQGTYAPHLHTCQYKESRWAFLSRLMEREGLYYFFEHGQEREKLVFADHRSLHETSPTEPSRYIPLSGAEDAMSSEAFSMFRSSIASVPASTQLRDFDYLKPQLDVVADAPIADHTAAAQFHHGEHDFRTPGEGKPLVEAHAQMWLAREQRYHGRGRVLGVRSGYRFSLDEHPIESMNREYLAVALLHSANQAADSALVRELLGIRDRDDYRVNVDAIAADTPYRPPRRTPVPCIGSAERAFVDGPADSEYAQIDEHGRYKVKFHFDIDDSEAWQGEASTWLRMLQPHGGVTEGFHFPLRKSTEVLVVFLGGNPDRPVIAGVVPNAVQPSPVTSDNHTQNVVQTGGENRFEMEDTDGRQYIDISTPPKDTRIHLGEPHDSHTHYIVFNTEGNQLVNIGGSKDIEIGGEQKEHVAGSLTESYDTDRTETVGGPVAETYGASHTTDVSGPRKVTIGGGEDRDVTGTWDLEASGIAVKKAPTIQTLASGSYLLDSPDSQLATGSTRFYASTMDTVWGATTINWGATSGTIASLSLGIPGGATISTSSWKVNVPDEGWNFASLEYAGSKKTELTGFSAGATGISIGVCGLEVKADGVFLKTWGALSEKGGAESKGTGASSKVAAVKSYLTGLFSVA